MAKHSAVKLSRDRPSLAKCSEVKPGEAQQSGSPQNPRSLAECSEVKRGAVQHSRAEPSVAGQSPAE